MNITEMIANLKKVKKEYGDAELLFCNQNGEVHYDFIIEDWTDNELPFKQILIKGCTPNAI